MFWGLLDLRAHTVNKPKWKSSQTETANSGDESIECFHHHVNANSFSNHLFSPNVKQ